MKRNILTIVFLLGILSVSESFAQRYHRHSYRRYSPPPRVRLFVPRVIVPPIVRFYSPRTRVIITPPPLFFGGGRGWRHYHQRGFSCNGRCHRWYDDNDYHYRNDPRGNDPRGNDRRYYENDRPNQRRYDGRRYNYYDNRYENNKNENQESRKIDTDKDFYEEEETENSTDNG